MFIKSNPKDKTYRDLLDIASDVCDEFILVVRSDMGIEDNIDRILERLKSSLKEVKEQCEWPGTVVIRPALVYRYFVNKDAILTLKDVANSLYEWVQSNLPEDLTFIKNHNPWLITTSHESLCYIITDEKEEIEKIMKIEGIQVKILN